MHITRCQHPTRRKLLNKTAREILAWMIDSGVGMELADIVYRYLKGHSKITMRSCLSQGQEKFAKLAGDTDALGWDSFIAGRIAKEWGKVSVIEHRRMGTGFQEEKWGATLVDKLLQLTHRQWILRNTEIHYNLPDGFFLSQHEDVFNHALNLWQTLDPGELLDRHQHLLKMTDGELGRCSPLRRQMWIADVESAMEAKVAQQQKAGGQVQGARGREEEPDQLEE
jgi:hypothetical protein